MFSFLVNLVSQAVGFIRTVMVQLYYPPPSPVARQTRRKSFSADVHRADDLLVLRLDFYNLRVDIGGSGAGGKRLVADGPGDSFVAAVFPPQHVAEQAFLEDAPNDPLLPPPVAARLAGESRLVFHLNPALLPLDFRLEAILDALSRSAPLVGDRVWRLPGDPAVGGTAEFGALNAQISAIEAPWRLTLSPHPDGRWAHAKAPVRAGTRTELWHTRLGVKPPSGTRVDEASTANRTARAVFSPDYSPADKPAPASDLSPFRASLKRYHRHYLVRLTAKRDQQGRDLDGNAPVAVERLMLSALGSWLQVRGAWDNEVTNIDLIEWQHRATLGRDQFVKVVEAGYLFPLGHKAVLITITERKLASVDRPEGLSGPTAYLRQRTFIVIKEPVKAYSHREIPFRTVTFTKLRSPNLTDPPTAPVDTLPAGNAIFWPRTVADNRDVLFQLEGVDWDGRTVSFAAPLIFVPFSADVAGSYIPFLVMAYNGRAKPPGVYTPVPDEDARRSLPMGGQKIAFAPWSKPGDTTHETETLILGALNATGKPRFLPAMRGARVAIPAVRQIAGASAVSLIRYDRGYLDAPPTQFGNAGEVFARIDKPAGVKFPVEKTGGLVAPDFTPQGLSRSFGPVGDVDNFAQGVFDASKIFTGIKILGGIPLDGIFPKTDPPFGWPAQVGPTVPGLTTVKTKDGVRTQYTWITKTIQKQGIFVPLAGASFRLDSVIDTPLAGPPSFRIDGHLERFLIVLPPAKPLIGAKFDHVRFHAGTNEKVDVSVKFDDITFQNELSFIDDVRKYIPLDGFVDPPYLDVDARGVSAGFTLAIPTIGVGIFSLQDLSLSAGFHLPFIGDVGDAASLRFAFCERDHPFLVTVSLFGGGGFFAVDLNTREVTNLEVSIEFGAAIAIDLGVAAGRASITGGFYLQKTSVNDVFIAFFRAAGELSVLGLISVSIELYIGLGFEGKPGGGTLTGTASVKVKIKIVFFSVSVSVSMRRELAGSDPTFAQMVEPDDWKDYCGAFALEGP